MAQSAATPPRMPGEACPSDQQFAAIMRKLRLSVEASLLREDTSSLLPEQPDEAKRFSIGSDAASPTPQLDSSRSSEGNGPESSRSSDDINGEIGEAEAEAVFDALLRSAGQCIDSITPIVGEIQDLPGIVQELVELVRKIWRLSRVRGRRQRTLDRQNRSGKSRVSEKAAAWEEAARSTSQSAEVGQGEKLPELLEASELRLMAARKSLKERDWELTEARRRIEQLERDCVPKNAHQRQAEASMQREVSVKSLAERRCPVPDNTVDIETLRQQLSSAEVALIEAHRDLQKSERDGEEARHNWQRRVEELEIALAESRRVSEALEFRLERETPVAEDCHTTRVLEPIGGTGDGCAAPVQKARHSIGGASDDGYAAESGGDAGSGGDVGGRPLPAEAPTPLSSGRDRRRSHPAKLGPGDLGEGVAEKMAAAAVPQRGGGRPARASTGSNTGHKPRSGSATRLRKEGVEEPRTLSRSASNSMPMNLQSLGKMLTGSGSFLGMT